MYKRRILYHVSEHASFIEQKA